MRVKLLWVVYKPELQKLEVTVQDANGKKRRIDHSWFTKEKTPPPENWFEVVSQEVEFRMAEELAGKPGDFF